MLLSEKEVRFAEWAGVTESHGSVCVCVCVLKTCIYVKLHLFSYFSFVVVMNVKMKFEDFTYL